MFCFKTSRNSGKVFLYRFLEIQFMSLDICVSSLLYVRHTRQIRVTFPSGGENTCEITRISDGSDGSMQSDR